MEIVSTCYTVGQYQRVITRIHACRSISLEKMSGWSHGREKAGVWWGHMKETWLKQELQRLSLCKPLVLHLSIYLSMYLPIYIYTYIYTQVGSEHWVAGHTLYQLSYTPVCGGTFYFSVRFLQWECGQSIGFWKCENILGLVSELCAGTAVGVNEKTLLIYIIYGNQLVIWVRFAGTQSPLLATWPKEQTRSPPTSSRERARAGGGEFSRRC